MHSSVVCIYIIKCFNLCFLGYIGVDFDKRYISKLYSRWVFGRGATPNKDRNSCQRGFLVMKHCWKISSSPCEEKVFQDPTLNVPSDTHGRVFSLFLLFWSIPLTKGFLMKKGSWIRRLHLSQNFKVFSFQSININEGKQNVDSSFCKSEEISRTTIT